MNSRSTSLKQTRLPKRAQRCNQFLSQQDNNNQGSADNAVKNEQHLDPRTELKNKICVSIGSVLDDKKENANVDISKYIVHLTSEFKSDDPDDAKNSDNCFFVGTGVIIHVDVDTKYSIVLTAAHNVNLFRNFDDKPRKATSVWMNEEDDNSGVHFEVYDAYSKKNKQGNDLALIFFNATEEQMKPDFVENIPKIRSFNNDQHSMIVNAMVYGYPAGQSVCCGAGGKAKFLPKQNVISYLKPMIYTSGGQSGSPVWVRREQGAEGASDPYDIGGIHTSGDDVNGERWGCMIQQRHLQWIQRTLGQQDDNDEAAQKALSQFLKESKLLSYESKLREIVFTKWELRNWNDFVQCTDEEVEEMIVWCEFAKFTEKQFRNAIHKMRTENENDLRKEMEERRVKEERLEEEKREIQEAERIQFEREQRLREEKRIKEEKVEKEKLIKIQEERVKEEKSRHEREKMWKLRKEQFKKERERKKNVEEKRKRANRYQWELQRKEIEQFSSWLFVVITSPVWYPVSLVVDVVGSVVEAVSDKKKSGSN